MRLAIPDFVLIYNKIMGGTDLWDQLVALYNTQVRTRHWQTRIIFHLLDGMVVNALILYKQTYGLKRGDDYFSLKDFKTAIVKDWAGEPRLTRQISMNGRFQTSAASKAQTKQHMHTPAIQADTIWVTGANAGKPRDMRQRCSICSSKTRYFCRECYEFVCISDNNSNRYDDEDTIIIIIITSHAGTESIQDFNLFSRKTY